jgi:signal transduction histidine kinase
MVIVLSRASTEPSVKKLALDILTGLLAAAAGLALRWLLDPLLGGRGFGPGYLVVAVSCWYLGWRAAIVTACAFYFGANYFFVEPRGRFSFGTTAEISSLVINLISSAVMIFIVQKLRVLQTQLAAANRELEANARRKDEFLATLSHELRNPLAPIVTSAHILERETLPGTTAREAVQILARQTNHLSGLLDDLLDLTRIARGRIDLRKTTVDVRACVEDAVQSCRALAAKKHQMLSVQFPPGAVELIADPRRLTQIVANLVNNATRYSQEGGQIYVRVTAQNGNVEFYVTDDGPGIEAARLPHIFNPFYAGHPIDRTTQGLGIGLSLTKSFVDLHGGSIEARSAGAGKGAEFVVRLPVNDGVS